MGVVKGTFNHPYNGFIMVRCLIHIYAEQFRQLGGTDDNCRRIGKTVHNRMGQKVNNKAQAKNAKQQLENTNSKRQDNCIGNKGFTSG